MIDSRKDMGKHKALTLFIAYLLFFSVYTLLIRTPGPRRWNLIPFWEIRYALSGGTDTFHYLVINILLCIPMGYFAACAFENDRKWKIILRITCFSVLIEIVQLLTGRGLCEFDDVFNNTLGGAIGMLCYFGPLEFFDAAAVTVVYGAAMVILEFRDFGDFIFWRVPEVLVHTYILYIPAHAVISVFIYKMFGMYNELHGTVGVRAAGLMILANLMSVLSKFLIQYFFAYSFSVTKLYYVTGFLLQCILTMYVRRKVFKIDSVPEETIGGNK